MILEFEFYNNFTYKLLAILCEITISFWSISIFKDKSNSSFESIFIAVPSAILLLSRLVLGFDSLEQYIKSFDLPAPPYFGATVGRFAGRINNGSFFLNGKTIQLHQNNNEHALHGGNKGFSQVVWEKETATDSENNSITKKVVIN